MKQLIKLNTGVEFSVHDFQGLNLEESIAHLSNLFSLAEHDGYTNITIESDGAEYEPQFNLYGERLETGSEESERLKAENIQTEIKKFLAK